MSRTQATHEHLMSRRPYAIFRNADHEYLLNRRYQPMYRRSLHALTDVTTMDPAYYIPNVTTCAWLDEWANPRVADRHLDMFLSGKPLDSRIRRVAGPGPEGLVDEEEAARRTEERRKDIIAREQQRLSLRCRRW